MSRAGVGLPMRRWTVTLREVTAETMARAEALALHRWGTSARVLAVDEAAKTVTFVGPDSESAVADFRSALDELAESEPASTVARRSRGRRWR